MSLKVLYIAHNHPSVRPGGAEQHALELHRAMSAAQGVESVLLTKGGPPVGPIGRIHDGTCIAPIASYPNEYFIYTDGYSFDYLNGTMTGKEFYSKHFRAFLLAIRPDVVHFQHTLFLGYDLIREVANTLPNAAILYTLHEYLPICARDGQMVRSASNDLCEEESPQRCHGCFPNITPQAFFLRKRFIQSQFALVDLFLAPSRFLMQRYVEWGVPTQKIRFQDYGRTPVRSGKDQLRSPRNRLAYFGQLSGYKGVDVLLEAMRLLDVERLHISSSASAGNAPNGRVTPAEADDRITLKIHGANLDLQDGEFRRTITRLLEETRHTVTLVGKYQQVQLPELMREIDWVVVPSIWWENSPLVIQEAFMNGRPVICSDIGGMAEKVTDGVNGIHFRVGDPASLAAAIRRAVQFSPTWDQMRLGIPPTYALSAQVSELHALYLQLLAGGPSRSKVRATIA
jgi:glycosyltransferase involved in cell wall biosynthesis